MTAMDRESELALVARLRAGDAAAFDVVHERFNARLFNFLTRLSRRRDVAEDLLEETWLRLVHRSAALHPDTRLGPWLFTVARNLYVSYRRSRLVEDSHAGGLIGLWPFGSPTPSPFESTAASEAERRVEAALGTLPVAYREALLLVAVEGLRPAEAAAACGITPEAMRQRLSRARALMARSIEDIGAPRLAALREVLT
jgi:RNA polymerase sigma factor (sigma-70 family)